MYICTYTEKQETKKSGLIYHETLEVFKSESQVKFPPSDVLF